MEKCLISVDRFTESSQDSLTHGPHSRLDLKMGKSSLISTSLYFASSIFTSGIIFLSFLRPLDLKSQLMSWPSMPTIALVVDIIASHPEHDIVIGIDTLGKEELLIHISRVLNIKVRPERLQTMHILGFHDTFTTKTSLTRVQAVPHNSFSIETLEGLDTMRPTIGIMPSGLPWVPKPVKGDVNLFGSLLTSCYKKRQSSDKLDVPYSDHSCFAEIQEFIELF
ncbi:hypothetical protein NC653_031529 [Populus alba x Populus x berolinensis]|uniref:5' exonuclease Apollo n=1 Tax=Populus alba x Populus x berolinensis TaxID=444605 RepID=A0AAD6LZ04_9ROSI|nr:hypothetical protein NC653_031529 [Populus alba x Populus x berolinensis]